MAACAATSSCADDDLPQRLDRVDALLRIEHGDLVLRFGIAQPHAQQEAIELRFGQREGAFVLDRVLRGHHQKRLVELVRLAVDGDLPFFHRFQQRGLRLGRGPIDLVGEHDVGLNGAGLIHELARALIEDAHAGHVAGQHVGRELDALELAPDRFGDRFGEHRLARRRARLR